MGRYAKIMFKMTKGHRGLYLFGFFLTFLGVVFSLTSIYVNKILIDVLNGDAPAGKIAIFITNNILGGQEFLRQNIWIFALSIIGITTGMALIQTSKNIVQAAVNTSIMKEMQLKLFYHIERLPYPKLKTMKNGDLIQTCTRDEEVLRNFVIGQINMIVYTFCIVILSFLILLTVNVTIAVTSIIILPVLSIYSFFLIKEVRKRYRKTDDSESRMTSKIEENLSAVRVVKAYNNEKYEIEDFEKYLADYEKKFIRWRKTSSFYFASSDILVFGQIVLSLLTGIYLGTQGKMNIGDLYLAVTFTSMIVWPVRQVAQILSNLAQAIVSMDRMDLILNEPLEDITTGLTPTIQGDFIFDGTGFQYADGNEEVLHDINLHVHAGETIAVMGKTGSGKSTFVNLLTRLYDYTEGHILLDGVELKDIQKEYLRRNIASVLQEPFLFSKTIINNLKMANKNASEKEILRATTIADIHNTILSFEQGYDTPVGEKGVTLSGGQKQRLAIARTIINDVPILIFDDSLSAVDTETDLNIRSALKSRAKNTTTVIVTHRVATAKDADRIIVFENGTITQCGTHDELVNKDGLYKRVYDIQTRII
ncbi:MAG TPA: ABC transporter ATP-binding protein [Bacilli bacterium]|nr:ABC transporter ATP-binding protein [Bacilli bacterium]